MTILYVAIGGAIGSVARYVLSAAVARYSDPSWPLGTFAVNVIGCFAFGAIAAAAERHFVANPPVRAFLLIGVLGGFTTFSSYTYETFELLREAKYALALVNAGGQVVISFVALWLGYAVVRAL